MLKGALNKISLRSFFILLVVILVSFFFLSTAKPSEAANLTGTFLRLDRMIAGGTPSGTACAKITTVASTEGRVVVTFPSTFTLSTTPGDWTINTAPTNGWPTIGGTTAPWVGTGTTAMAADNSAKTVTFASADLTDNTKWYCFNFTGAASSNGTAGIDKLGSIATQTSGAGAIDSGNYATSIISNDQIVVSATVPPNFSLALGGGGTAPFTASLSSTSAVSTAGSTATLITNANNGWIAWVKSANAALSSASTGATIPTAGSYPTITDVASSNGYVLDCDITTDSGTGTGTVSFTGAGGYNGTNATSGGALTQLFQPLATANGTTAGDVLTLYARAKVTAVQQAANDYTDTLTVVAAGLY